MEARELIIIGGGPAGYVAAIRAAQLGGKVTLIEEAKLGGICLNHGCIPSKTLLHSVELYESIKNAGEYGITTTGVSIDLAKMMARKSTVISTLVSGVQGLLKVNGVEVINGRARLLASMQVEITDGQGQKQVLTAQKIIIATGARPIILPIPGADSPRGVIGAESVLDLERVPESLLMIGGGVIGVEMATILAKLGSKVTIVEMLPHILPLEDVELTAVVSKALQEDGVEIYEGAKVSAIEDAAGGKAVTVVTGEGEKKLVAEVVAIGVGYRPNLDGLGLEEAGVAVEKGAIKVNDSMATGVPDIYAAGDAVGGMMLAYVAMEEG
ncbi:MAG: FAD-dependent oxidoreductase, partial [Dehalococcoidales bacterium]